MVWDRGAVSPMSATSRRLLLLKGARLQDRRPKGVIYVRYGLRLGKYRLPMFISRSYVSRLGRRESSATRGALKKRRDLF